MTEQNIDKKTANGCTNTGIACKNFEQTLKNPKQKLGKDFKFSDDETNSSSASEPELNGFIPEMKPPKCTQTPMVSNYISRLHKELNIVQKSFLSLSREYTRMKFKLRQVIEAKPEHQARLLSEMQRYAYSSDEEATDNELGEKDLGKQALEKLNPEELRARQTDMITELRQRLSQLVEVSHVYSHAAPPDRRVSLMSKDSLSNRCMNAVEHKHHLSKEEKKYSREQKRMQNSTRVKKSVPTQGQPYAKQNDEKKSKRKL